MTLAATLKVRVEATKTGPNGFADTFAPLMTKVQALANGTGANQADLIYMDERSVASASNDDLDLAGILTDSHGQTITFAEIVAIVVINEAINGTQNTTDLTIGAATNPFVGFLGGTTPTVGPIKPGGVFLMAAGNAAGIGTVTPATADILRIANSSGATATYQIAIIGRSA